MKVKELQEALCNMATVLESLDSKETPSIEGVLKLLEGADDQDLEPFLHNLEKQLAAALKQTKAPKTQDINQDVAQKYADLLHSADMDEGKFVQIFTELQNNPLIRKGELTEIAKLYHARPATTVAKLQQSIKTRFYERIYDRDATEMAHRATPW